MSTRIADNESSLSFNFEPPPKDDTAEAAYRLAELKLYNWGPFGGFHCAPFDPQGTAIVGPAYSNACRPPIPIEAGHPFHLMPATDSNASRPPLESCFAG